MTQAIPDSLMVSLTHDVHYSVSIQIIKIGHAIMDTQTVIDLHRLIASYETIDGFLTMLQIHLAANAGVEGRGGGGD